MKKYCLIIVVLFFSVTSFAQKERKYIREGNRYYEKAQSDTARIDTAMFEQAEIAYRKALDKKPGDFKAQYNVANALFKQQKMADSQTQYEEILDKAETKEDRSKVYFNIGNTLLAQQKLDESIEAYKNALRNNPKDLEAKYNLEFARKMKQQQEQQQQQQDQNKDQQDQNKDQQDQNKDQQDQNKDQQDQNKDQQDQNKDQQNQNKDQQDQNKDQQQQQQQQNKISAQNAEQMLKALENDEKETQEKVNKMKAQKAQSSRVDKDW